MPFDLSTSAAASPDSALMRALAASPSLAWAPTPAEIQNYTVYAAGSGPTSVTPFTGRISLIW